MLVIEEAETSPPRSEVPAVRLVLVAARVPPASVLAIRVVAAPTWPTAPRSTRAVRLAADPTRVVHSGT